MLIKTLIDFNADVDAYEVDDRTALIHVARTNNVSFAILLLEGGANINALSTAAQTPLTTAIFADHETLAILSLTNHIRLKFDKNYHTGDFMKTLQMRHDGDDKLNAAFSDFMGIVREEVSPEELMEQGMSFD
ncbi:hypothetical protein B0T18DRAFT_424104 [Schizothecium vesticola]|uniref:Ankyrin n=1 Tax=Schizothecium vesticola TaxID=314040 RepID=A0AA40F9L3_9PEZI|nr:hypothetical protein B0T18DRAFT_424104 [Schizothecium vesticola]